MNITEIFAEARDLVDADSTSYPDTALLRRVNSAIKKLVGKIQQVTINFPFDDSLYGNINVGTFDLEEGVAKYTIADRFKDILEIKVKDINGQLSFVAPYSLAEASRDGVILESLEATTGIPATYRMVGRTIFLEPAPTAAAVTLTAGFQIAYTRTSYKITSADVSLVPGIDEDYHETIAKMIALPYAKSYKKDRVAQLERDIAVEINDMLVFYANRQKDRVNRITIKKRPYK